MVARWFIEWVVSLVHFSDDAMVVGSILMKVVVLCSILLDQLHILQFCGVVVLPTHVIVDFVGIIRDVTDFFYVRSNSPIEPSLVIALAEHVPLVHNLLPKTFLPQLFSSTSSRPDPSSPVQPFEAHDHSAQRFSLSLVDVEQSDAITILGHLLPSIERIRLLPLLLRKVMWRCEARVELEGGRGGERGWSELVDEWLAKDGWEEGGQRGADGGGDCGGQGAESGQHFVPSCPTRSLKKCYQA